MPPLLKPASIRGRLVLLVLALWLPAVAGLGLQAYEAYQSQKDALKDEMRQQALALRVALDAEIERRFTLARALSALPSLEAGDTSAFERAARGAVQGTQDAVLLLDRERQYFNTDAPGRPPIARPPQSLFVENGTGIHFAERGPASGQPVVALLVPEARHTPPRFDVAVPFPIQRIQTLIAQQPLRAGTVASVIDAQQRVMGRSREPERWIGTRASHTVLRDMAAAGESGFVRTTTLDKVASLTYLSPPGPHGWATVVAVPEQSLTHAAWRLATRAVTASAVLLAVGLGLALLAARRISGPVQALERAASDLLARRVPPPLNTGFTEVDRVGGVLHDAAAQAHEWGEVLQARVREASEEARRAEASLFEARKHEAVGRLTGAIAHDFNNLLQTVSMGLQVVQRSVPEGRHTKALMAALAACGRAGDQVRQMLAFGRVQQMQLQPVNLADLLLRSRDLTDKALGERVQLLAQIDPDLPPVLADPAQLELAVLNLVFNARDAMPGRGTVALRASEVDGAAAGLQPQRYVRIEVEDDGQGMDPETLARVFEPYFTTKPVGAGTGLGLPQVQAFARQSGGEVRIRSTPGQGTCVSVFLPVAQAQPAAEAAPAQASAPGRRKLKILMVEDDVLVASVVMAALEHEGHAVSLCRTADDALPRLSAGEAFDVLFTDVMMPGSMTGLELAAWAREHRPEVPALVATGYSARTTEGPWRVLRKPYVIEDLLATLEAICAEPVPAQTA